MGIQKGKLPNINSFYTKDAGINFHQKINKRCEFNSYNYYISESFDGYTQSFAYRGSVSTLKRRIFTVNNLKYYTKTGILSINSGVDNSKGTFRFGNINNKQKAIRIYTSINYEWRLLENMNLQFGISYEYHHNEFNDSIPTYYYALSPGSPNHFSIASIQNHILDAYLYTNWDINDKLTFSSGIRSNLPVEDKNYYFSSQLGLKYRLNKKQLFLLSGGKYHNYSTPNYFSKKYDLLSSYQIALDYTYALKNTLLKAATYFKNETSEQSVNAFLTIDKNNTFGLEVYIEHNFYKYFKFSLSNSFINQKITINEKEYNGAKDFNYLVKSVIQYHNPKLFSLALTYIGRPGTYYNEITHSTFDDRTGFYEPIFSADLYNAQYGNYNRFDISLSRYIRMKKNALIIFVSLNNVFNAKNESIVLYNTDYSTKYFDFYQRRIIYFGLVWQFNY